MTIVAEIAADLKARIQDRRPPERLTLAALAEHYGVSFTPVRAVVDLLVRERYLHKQSNGRLEFGARASGRDKPGARPARRAQAPKAAASSAAADCEAALVREIIARSLRGQEGYLREQATARRLALGRTAVRHAFGRLAGKGLLEHVPRCGWRVRTFDAADLEAYLEAREALELKALELARPRLVGEDLQRMLRGNSPVAGRRERLDNRLHAYLVEKARNRYLADFFERHGLYYTTLLDHAAPAAQVVAEMARQHRAILRALLAQDWPRARRRLRHHIRAQRPIIEMLLARLKSTAG